MTEEIETLTETIDRIFKQTIKVMRNRIELEIKDALDFEVFKCLIERGYWEYKTKKFYFESILSLMCKDNQPNRVKIIKSILDDKEANINILDSEIFRINNLLFDSLSYGANMDVIRYFLDDLKIPLDIKNCKDEEGRSLLLKMFSPQDHVYGVCCEDFKYLVEEKGLNILDKDNDGYGIKDYFYEYIVCHYVISTDSNENIDIMKYLTEKGIIFDREEIVQLLDCIQIKKDNYSMNGWKEDWASFAKYLDSELKKIL
jgi:hypothetical protein